MTAATLLRRVRARKRLVCQLLISTRNSTACGVGNSLGALHAAKEHSTGFALVGRVLSWAGNFPVN